jgi:acyl carrier protein
MSSNVSHLENIKRILGATLQLGGRTSALTESTRLLGNIPEMDSMAVVTVLTAIEDHYGFAIEDDEISAEVFETVGTLTAFVAAKDGARP